MPTIAESAIPGFDVQSWFSLMAPAATPAAVVERLATEVSRALRSPKMRQSPLELGATPSEGDRESARRFIAAEIEKWAAAVKQSGAKAE